MKVPSAPVIAAIVIVSLFAGITIYSGIIPPASVVESGSMQHSSNWEFGVINTGDIVLVKKVDNPVKGITTYVQGRTNGYSTYGDYGNVILYNNGHGTVVIHRAMFYLTWSKGNPVVMGYTNQSWITVTHNYVLIRDVGYSHKNLVVFTRNFVNESGFITMGDHNLASQQNNSPFYVSSLHAYEAADQNVNIMPIPVPAASVVGKAYGQIPWFGLIKLNIMKLQGDWQYSSDVPNHSYEYLTLSLIAIGTLVFFPYKTVAMANREKKERMGREKQ